MEKPFRGRLLLALGSPFKLWQLNQNYLPPQIGFGNMEPNELSKDLILLVRVQEASPRVERPSEAPNCFQWLSPGPLVKVSKSTRQNKQVV